MTTKNVILIGGALALLLYVSKTKNAAPSAATLAAAAPNASTQYTTTQSADAADWYKFAGSWK